jgi:hypothetical protein
MDNDVAANAANDVAAYVDFHVDIRFINGLV